MTMSKRERAILDMATRKVYAHDACIRAMDLEHVATDVRLACLAGKTTHVVKGRLPTRYVTRLTP
jgi:hypothetical protein